jgi:GAF domain-containing protein
MELDTPPRNFNADAFGELDGLVQSASSSLTSVLDTLVDLAKRALLPVSEVSITLVRGQDPFTAAFSGQPALDLDERQYEQGHGPCLDAASAGEIIQIPDMARETRWPEFAESARAAGVRSSLSVSLPVQRQLTGALNLYGDEPDSFDARAVDLAKRFADHAAVAVATTQLYESTAVLAQQMKEAMDSRATIEQAKGIIMGDRQCSPTEAFEALVKLSQESHIKLRELAGRLVAHVGGATPVTAD